jgi:hypothetical protein
MNLSSKFIILIIFMSTYALIAVLYSDQGITFRSLESKGPNDSAIYNKINWFTSKDKDIWMMNQSHHGLIQKTNTWDRLAIIIDKTKSPKTAQFFQLKPGDLNWTENPLTQELRASCYICHSNGLRAIRPDFSAPEIKLTWFEKSKIFLWNLKIKSYGRIVPHESHLEKYPNIKMQFKYFDDDANEKLQIKTCTKCHNDKYSFSRGSLTRQNGIAIQFMIKNGLMPPLNNSLSEVDQKEITKFLAGF